MLREIGREFQTMNGHVEGRPMSKTCPRCGEAVAPSDTYCVGCGATLETSSALTVTPSGGEMVVTTPTRRRLGGTPWVPALGATGAGGVPVVGEQESLPKPMPVRRKRVRRRRRRRPWFRRPLVVAPLILLLVVVSVGSWYGYALQQTFSGMRQIGRPEGNISGDALGGDASVEIDTGPALSYVDSRMPDSSGGGGLLDGFRAAAAGAKDLANGAAAAAGLSDPPDDAMTVLLMGVDARPGEPIDISVRADALMVLRLDPNGGTCRILSIPRDTRAELPGYGMSKINHALAVGGIHYQKFVVSDLLGIELDHYALIDFYGFKSLVDAVGGVTVTIPEEFTAGGIDFKAGPQKLDGDAALAFARYRGGPDRDLGRIRNQHQLIGALLRASAGRDIVRDVNEILPALKAHIRTDLRPAELIDLARQYRSTCTAESIRLFSLSGTVSKFDDPLLRRPLDYFVVTDAEIRQKVAELSAT